MRIDLDYDTIATTGRDSLHHARPVALVDALGRLKGRGDCRVRRAGSPRSIPVSSLRDHCPVTEALRYSAEGKPASLRRPPPGEKALLTAQCGKSHG